MPAKSLFALFFLLVLSVGCDSNSESFDIAPFIGTYTGTRSDEAHGDTTPNVEDVTITIAADQDAGTVTITLNPEHGGPEVLNGRYDETGVFVEQTSAGVSLTFDIDAKGDIQGDGSFSLFGIESEVQITGVLTAQRFDLISIITVTRGDKLNPVGATSKNMIRTTRI